MKRVFISFRHEDRPQINGLRLLAANAKFDVEFYDESLRSAIRWYDSKSASAQKYFKRVKIAEFVVSGAVPISAVTLSGWFTAVLGAIVILLESLQQLYQWQHHWITYRSTCESLRHEKYTYLGRTGAYHNANDGEAMRQLIERVEGLVSTEHSKWLSRQERQVAAERKPGGGG